MVEEGPEIRAIERAPHGIFFLTTPALVGICVGGTVLLLCVAAVTCFCYRRRRQNGLAAKLGKGRRHGPDQPLAFHSHRRPTAVKSPAGPGNATHYLKKSPSPTSGSKSPPGVNEQISGPATPSPTGSQGPPESQDREPQPNGRDVYSAENEVSQPHTPSKEELETNEKNLAHGPTTDNPGFLGQIVFKLRYKHDKNALVVSVVKCKELPAKDPNLGSSDPYVKLQLLPDKQHKVKTRVLRKTRNPVYDEDFTFYGINFNQLPGITLHFVVLSFDRYSRDDIIGEVFCALSTVDLAQAENQQIALSRDIQPRSLKVIGRLELGGTKSTGSALNHWNEVCNSPRRQIADWHKLRE